MRRLAGQRLALIACLVILAACGSDPGQSDQPSSTESAPIPSPPSASGTGGDVEGALSLSLVATYDPDTIPGLDVLGYISVGPDGHLFVPNAGSSEMLELDGGTVVRRWGEAGTEAGQFGFLRDPEEPDSALGGVAIAPDGTIYVVEAGNRRVQRFSAAGESELTFGSSGDGDGQFIDPIGVALSPSSEVFIVDDARDDIQVFSSDGEYLRTIGAQGSAPGELLFAGNIRFSPYGELVNADFGNSRVQAWGTDEVPLWTLGTHGTGPGEFVEPQDVAFAADGTMYVVDDSRVQAFDSQMNVIGVWPDGPSMGHLASIALDGDTLWVVAPYVDTLYEIRVSATE